MNIENNKNYEQALAQVIEQKRILNNSIAFNLGKQILLFMNLFLQGKFIQLYKRIRGKYRARQLYAKYSDKKSIIPTALPVVLRPIQTEGPSITIYTCIVGNYDAPKMPLLSYSNCHYILYTDKEIDAVGWEVRPLPPEVLNWSTSIEKNRYLKFHPHCFFDTPYSIYIDGNVQLLTDISDMLPLKTSKTGLGMFTHPLRNCVYTEARTCLFMKKGNKDKLHEQISQYQNEGLPAHYGLNEATLIATDLHNPRSKDILGAWWNEFLRSGSNRDQIALPYVLWKMGLKPSDIDNLGEDIRQDLRLQVHTHNL
ncbi:MAG: DUF616 domain-containing protein [Elusimicrobiaceae bacterium]|nr:DUF616 domain-containing protein [Elusimicrobiaceae bacterium]